MEAVGADLVCDNDAIPSTPGGNGVAGVVRKIVDRSGLRHAAAACIVAGGLVVGGPGVVIAAADTGGVGQHERDGSGPASDGGGVARGTKVGGVAPGRKV